MREFQSWRGSSTGGSSGEIGGGGGDDGGSGEGKGGGGGGGSRGRFSDADPHESQALRPKAERAQAAREAQEQAAREAEEKAAKEREQAARVARSQDLKEAQELVARERPQQAANPVDIHTHEQPRLPSRHTMSSSSSSNRPASEPSQDQVCSMRLSLFGRVRAQETRETRRVSLYPVAVESSQVFHSGFTFGVRRGTHVEIQEDALSRIGGQRIQSLFTPRETRVPILFSIPAVRRMVVASRIRPMTWLHAHGPACACSRQGPSISAQGVRKWEGQRSRRSATRETAAPRPERIKKAFDFAAWKGGSDAVLAMAAWLARCRPAAVQRAARSHATASGSPIREELGR